ncbi:hypothetical protein SDRG_04824 [Saprolegnia diclina VS20]|uniref:Uncharacterized protein n=1 Tax=Saprolegnia diclina (strain VS20) TaxID=1156394 RepID=T0QUT4_SAPDV|nr:hypothetical protein SDRG_04824 [Saprolegnia diclina VS20]EQC37800.1 hypothetical protein SDRG_04824 [Saprolegnia diclina VS20]|eukprot:XP_008608733.1 hypothetical protein SDRG_04824 [Saprolegnia diclina VS20]
MMVRFAAQSSHPECYAVNGVNCLLGENVDDLLPLLAAYEGNRTSGNNDTSLSTFPAPCGPARREHWGNEGYSGSNEWCWAAKRQLPLFDARGSLAHCVSGPLGIAAVRSFQQRSYCVSKVQWSSFGECRFFSNWATCQASVERLLLQDDGLYSYGESSCNGNEKTCVDPPSYNYGFSLPSGDGLFGGILAGLFAVGVLGALAGFYIKKKDRQMAASRPAIEATVCSSKDGDEDDEEDDFPVYRASNYVRDDSRSEPEQP